MKPTAEPKIVLILEGTDQDEGHVRLDVFLSQLTKFRASLAGIDESLSDGERSTEFTIVGLSHESPATVEVMPRRIEGKRDLRSQVSARMSGILLGLQKGAIPPDVDIAILRDVKGLISPIGTTLKSSSIEVSGQFYELTPKMAFAIEEHIARQRTCKGTIEGMLEKINVHADSNTFTIFPSIGPRKVSCHFPPELVDLAIASVKRRVAVTGLMRYQMASAFPFHVEVSQIVTYGNPAQLPSFLSLRGIAPEATGDLASEDFVAGLRDAW